VSTVELAEGIRIEASGCHGKLGEVEIAHIR
jgi:hypothetical protein